MDNLDPHSAAKYRDIFSRADLEKLPKWSAYALLERMRERVEPLFSCALSGDDWKFSLDDSVARQISALGEKFKDRWHQAGFASWDQDNVLASQHLVLACHLARCALVSAGFDPDRFDKALNFDFELIRQCHELEKWPLDSPIPQAFFGPLWPYQEPAGWPFTQEKTQEAELQITLNIPNSLPTEEITKIICELCARLNALHIAYGGSGLKLSDLKVWEPKDEE